MGKTFRIKPIIRWIVRIAGLFMILAAIWPDLAGLDRSPGWGPARKFLMIVGLSSFLTSLVERLLGYVSSEYRNGNWGWLKRIVNHPIKEKPKGKAYASRIRSPIEITNTRAIALLTVCLFLLSSLGITWLISVGRWTGWPETTKYFHMLADGFRSGRAHLLLEPDPRLLALDDPYEFDNREGIPYLWDATLFGGKYYMYWGPVPALVSMSLETFLGRAVGDHELVWLFSLGTLFWLLAILHTIYVQHFKFLPIWIYLVGGVSTVLVSPFPWMVARPGVYETAIQSAQFFYLGGVYWLIRYFQPSSISRLGLFLSATFWALAVASRASFVTLVIPMSLLILGVIWMRQNRNNPRGILTSLILFSLPLIVGAGALAYYNYARFGSIFEMGHQYALSSWKMNHDYSRFVVSIENFGPNVYNYFLRPFRTIEVFPYIKARWGTHSVPALRMLASSTYSTENIVGIFLSTPIVLSALLPLIEMMLRGWRNLDIPKKHTTSINPFKNQPIAVVYGGLITAVILILFPLLFFHANSMRYTMDFLPTLLIISAVAYWSYFERLRGRRILTGIFALVVSSLAIYGGITGFLLGMTGNSSYFETYNPELFDKLTRIFTW